MFGMPRDASHASKLALMLDHLGFDRRADHDKLLDDVCAALLDDTARRARVGLPPRVINGSPLLEPSLRDAAFVIGAVWDAHRMGRFARAETIAAQARRTDGWLRPVLETHGLEWRWSGDTPRHVA